MKKIVFLLLILGGSVCASAQTTKEVTGAVIDKNGNRIPGAKIEATGGAETTVTDADGTFSLEVSRWLTSITASYPGLGQKKVSVKTDYNDMIITLKSDRSRWFANAFIQHDFNYENNAVGLMFGKMPNNHNWGWYVKVGSDTEPAADGPEDAGPIFTAGAIKNINDGFGIYFGAGYGACYPHGDDYYHYYYEDDFEAALMLDLGVNFIAKHFNVMAGFTYRRPFDDIFERSGYYDGYGLSIGFGYRF